MRRTFAKFCTGHTQNSFNAAQGIFVFDIEDRSHTNAGLNTVLLQRLVNRTKLLLVHLEQLNTAVQHMLESDPALCAEWNAAWNELGTTVKSAGDEITRRS